LLAEIPSAAMTVTSDYGNRSDVHPREKRVIAGRLVASAMHLAYGSKQEWQGPLIDALASHSSELIVSFTHTTGGLTTSDRKPMRGFEIAGIDGAFHPADATADGSTLHLTSLLVPAPVAARYDWQPFPDGNVINGAQFPCSTFTIRLSGEPHAR
jgi:sialate O-acetylesterase